MSPPPAKGILWLRIGHRRVADRQCCRWLRRGEVALPEEEGDVNKKEFQRLDGATGDVRDASVRRSGYLSKLAYWRGKKREGLHPVILSCLQVVADSPPL